MNVLIKKLEIESYKNVYTLNVKCDPIMLGFLQTKRSQPYNDRLLFALAEKEGFEPSRRSLDLHP